MDLTATDPRLLELQQLQREYRHMELNRRAYAEESQALLRKQQSTIDKLRKDNESLKNDISVIMRGSNRPMSLSQQEAVQILTDQGDKYATSIDFEQKNIKTMEEQIAITRQKILQQRRAMGGVNASKDNHFMIQKQIRILENRLDKSLIKFNESISNNKKLRDQIDDLRRERVVFENVYRKMERELQERKKQMAEIIEVSNQAYEQRDSYQMEVAAIEQANRKEQEEFEEQMVTLGRLLETDLQLPTATLASRTKSLSRLGTSTSSRGGNRLAHSQSVDQMGAGAAGVASTDDLFNKSGGGKTQNGVDFAGVDIDFHERAQNFEEAFNKIKNATGITNVDELVNTFIKSEEHNFSLFNYVNEQNNEIEKYEEQIQALREEEMKYAQESGHDVNQHKEILKDLESKLQASDMMAEKYEVRCQDLQRITESLKRGMQTIFSKFDFDNEEGAVEPTVTDTNIVHYLGLIEKKANQLLQSYSSIKQVLTAPTTASAPTPHPAVSDSQSLNSLDSSSLAGGGANANDIAANLVTVLGAGPKVPMGQDLMHINPPKADDYRSDEDDDEDDEDTRPLTRDELKNKTMNRLQRRIAGLGGGAAGAAALGASGGGGAAGGAGAGSSGGGGTGGAGGAAPLNATGGSGVGNSSPPAGLAKKKMGKK